MAEPLISLETAKAHLRIGDSDCEDRLIAEKVEMATAIACDKTDRDLFKEFTSENLPPAIRAAILLILGTLYDNHTDMIIGRSVSQLGLTADSLLEPWRKLPYGGCTQPE